MTRFACIVVSLVLVACGGGSDDAGSDAEDRVISAVEAFYKNQAGRVYDEYLLPSQRDLIERAHFIACNTETAGMDAEIEVDEVYTETDTVATIGETETTAVTYQLTANDRTITNTSHGVEVDGAWYVYYPQDRLDTYAAGECP